MPREEQVRIRVGEAWMRAHLALPDVEAEATADEGRAGASRSPRGGPGVVVVHELLGLNDDIRRIARRFAASGYAALAPDLFDGLGPKPICILRTLRAYHRGGGRALAALEAARAWLGAHPEVDEARLGVAGFCMGGGFALLLGRQGGVGVAAAYYCDVHPDAEALEGICPVVAGFGGRDRVFGENGHRLGKHLSRLGVAHDVVTYPDAGHSYMSRYEGWTARLAPLPPLRAGYQEGPAEDSWTRMLAFFGEHLAARPA